VDDVLQDDGRLKRILDIGCGTVRPILVRGGPDQQGMWLAEMAEIYPHVDCVGIDIIAQQHE
jgi:tRNA G46 methylase TrmB